MLLAQLLHNNKNLEQYKVANEQTLIRNYDAAHVLIADRTLDLHSFEAYTKGLNAWINAWEPIKGINSLKTKKELANAHDKCAAGYVITVWFVVNVHIWADYLIDLSFSYSTISYSASRFM